MGFCQRKPITFSPVNPQKKKLPIQIQFPNNCLFLYFIGFNFFFFAIIHGEIIFDFISLILLVEPNENMCTNWKYHLQSADSIVQTKTIFILSKSILLNWTDKRIYWVHIGKQWLCARSGFFVVVVVVFISSSICFYKWKWQKSGQLHIRNDKYQSIVLFT